MNVLNATCLSRVPYPSARVKPVQLEVCKPCHMKPRCTGCSQNQAHQQQQCGGGRTNACHARACWPAPATPPVAGHRLRAPLAQPHLGGVCAGAESSALTSSSVVSVRPAATAVDVVGDLEAKERRARRTQQCATVSNEREARQHTPKRGHGSTSSRLVPPRTSSHRALATTRLTITCGQRRVCTHVVAVRRADCARAATRATVSVVIHGVVRGSPAPGRRRQRRAWVVHNRRHERICNRRDVVMPSNHGRAPLVRTMSGRQAAWHAPLANTLLHVTHSCSYCATRPQRSRMGFHHSSG